MSGGIYHFVRAKVADLGGDGEWMLVLNFMLRDVITKPNKQDSLK